ncbi:MULTISPECIES: DUF3331 domain-containing protein [Paraburkholderia]|uniref:DUF3331 domain-containing protein n=1 Tax=Paraburkholderia TaxID=1822464 RepID=UPI00211B4217|nr:DUF3331 domain-containing protein [Paraburkholderia caledonica]
MNTEQPDDVWQHIIKGFFFMEIQREALINAKTVRAKRGRPSRIGDSEQVILSFVAARIAEIERRSRGTIAMDWADSTLGHYGEQLWSRGIARRKAVCALSGVTINRGDTVYKPRHVGGRTPLNATAMILASFLEEHYFQESSDRVCRT